MALDREQEDESSKNDERNLTKKYFLVGLAALIVGIGGGIGIGWAIRGDSSEVEPEFQGPETLDFDPFEFIDANTDNNTIQGYLRALAAEPHIGGSLEDEITTKNIVRSAMEEAGLTIKETTYNVLLSYPKREDGQRNYVALKDSSDNIIESSKSAEVEEILDDTQDDPLVYNPFIAYAKATPAEGLTADLVYVNYARKEDFIRLEEELKIDPTGKICICRYGKIFRGNKAREAEIYGCAGLIIFSDSADYAPEWTEPYPESWWLPGTGAQRGTTYLDNGDPETPFYPSIGGAYRWDREKVEKYGAKYDLPGLPNIPITPIGYNDAEKLLVAIGGDKAPEDWQGGIKDENGNVIDYNLGPTMKDGQKGFMFVRTTEETRDTTNVLGYFEGTVEPDRYVILGNHRDAWVFGAIDPSSGTCTMLEIVRVFGEMYRKGWRPRRTIMFASWGSEEYGLIGSQEFVEEHLTQLTASAVAYVNIDVAVGGNYSLSTRGTPNFEALMFETAKTVDNPRKVEDDGAATLYDNMMLRNAKDENGKLVFGGVGSGSDYAPFLQQVGVSVCDISWRCDPHYSYPVYHSVYETVPLVEKFVDPGYKIHQQVAKFTAKMMAQLSQDAKIPLKVVQYAARVSKEVNSLETALNNYPSNGVDLTFLKQYADKFTKAAADFQAKFEDATDAQEIKRLNDQVMRVERSFIDPNGLPERLQYRHVVFAPSSKNSYASAAFPAVYDALFEIEKLTGEEEITAWEMVKEQVSTLSFFIYNAAEALKLSVI